MIIDDEKADKHIDSSKVTSWSPCHLGRAMAVAASFGGLVAVDEKAHLVDDKHPENIYGSDVGGHLDLLAKRERGGRISIGSPDPTTVHHNTSGVAAGCSDRCICETCKAMQDHRKDSPNCECFPCTEYRRARVKMNPIPW